MSRGLVLPRRPALLVACFSIVGFVAWAQAPPPAAPPAGGALLLRFDAGLLDPDTPAKGVAALGAVVGWSAGANTLLLRYVRQLRDRTASIYVYDHARSFLLAQWEHGFGAAELLHRQYASRLGLGVMASYHRPAALTLSGGLTLHYPLGARLALVGSLEDNVAVLPHRDGVGCYDAGAGNVYCTTPPSGGWQHNFGVLASVEWWPSTNRFRAARAAPASAAEFSEAPVATAETPVGAVCNRLAVAPGVLVRVRTYARRDSATALLPRRSSEVGPLVRCEGGAVVLGSGLGQPAPELTILEPWIHQAWIRGNQALPGTLVGTGSGALIGVLLGSAKSYLCNGQPCAKHQVSSTLIGAVAGGTIGWAIGRATPRWIRRYP